MVLYINRFTIHPDKTDNYLKWTEGAIKTLLSVPGVVEMRAYRTAVGSTQIAVTWEFKNMADWAAWYSHEDVQKVIAELYTLAVEVTTELLGPSPVVPAPIRPGN